MADETFRKRQGTTDEGKDYENYVIADYVLKLTTDSTVKNFKLTSNDNSFGDFDDAVVEIEKEECIEKYALQLKHVSNDKKKLSLESLKGEDGNLSIKKYFRTFKKLSQLFSDYKLILLTNLTFTLTDGRDVNFQLNVARDVLHVKIVKCKAVSLLNTSQKSHDCFQFRIVRSENPFSAKLKEYEQFFDLFFLYTNQVNVDTLKKGIPKQIKKYFVCDDTVSNKHLDVVASEYVKYISEWSKRDGIKEKLNKPWMQQVMTLFLLNPFLLPISFNPVVSSNSKLLQEAIAKFDVTIFDKELDNTVRRIWSDAKNQFGDIKELNKINNKYHIKNEFIDCIEKLNDDECTKILWIMGKCPLIVSENPITIKAIKFCINRKFVLLGTNAVTSSLQQCYIFRDVNDLTAHPHLYKKLTKDFVCGTPGNKFSLEELLRNDKSMEDAITTNELLKMMDGPYVIRNQQETLPIAHISRSLSRLVVDFKYLDTVDRETLIVIGNVSNRQKIINCMKPTHHQNNVFLFQEKCSQEEFVQICRSKMNTKRRHHFEVFDEDFLEWLQSEGDTSDIERYLLDGYFLEEKCITNVRNSINVISDEPGKGKSVLLRSLKNQFCSESWVVMFSSVQLADLCATIRKTQYTNVVDVFRDYVIKKEISKFTSNFNKHILNFVLRKCRIIYLWDALDEISRENLDIVSNVIKRLPRQNCIHWITCRSHLKNYMQHELCVFCRNIAQFSEEEQRFYLEKRLKDIFSDTDFDDVITKIRSYLAFTTPDFFLGVPIQICMLTELFITNPEEYSSLMNTQFLVTDLYRHSIEEKIKLFYKDENGINYSHFEDCKKYRLLNYAEAALMELFEQDFVTSLNLRCEDFLEDIEQKGDAFGIITEIKGDDKKPHFVHSSYAEYFAATYFVKFYKKISTLKDILFDVKYTNTRFLFDILLAQDSIAHIAVLHKDLNALKQCGNLTCRDSGGRSVLHLACSWGERYPVLKCSSEANVNILENEDTYPVKKESVDYMKILEHVLEKLDPQEKDQMYNMTSLCYAKKSENLLTIAFIEKKQKINCLENEHHSMICSMLYYCVMFGHDDIINMFSWLDVIKTESNNSLLHLAVECNQPRCLHKLLSMDKYKKRINDINAQDCTALFLACSAGNENMVKKLLEFGAKRSVTKLTSLHGACAYGHVNIVQLLIPVRDDVDSANENSRIPQLLTSATDSITTSELLDEIVDNIGEVDEDGCTPLMVACGKGHDTVANLLIKSGAKVNVVDDYSWTPLMLASNKGYDAVVTLLIKSDATINAVTEDGLTALMFACSGGHDTVANLLIKSGAEVNAVNKYSWTAVMIACGEGYTSVANSLISSGANVNAFDEQGWTALMSACDTGHDTLANLLINSGANVNAVTKDGWTPLMFACSAGLEAVAKLLINSGADINIETIDGMTALGQASMKGNLKIVDLLIKSGLEVDERDKDGTTPLIEACCMGYYDLVKMLIKCGANINIVDKDGLTPLAAAFHNNHNEVVNLLIEHGADLNHMGGMYTTPLYANCEYGYLENVQSFIEMGADVNTVVYNGWRPIHIACYKGYEDIVKILLKSGADANAATSRGDSPIDIARENGHAQIVQLLCKYTVETHTVQA